MLAGGTHICWSFGPWRESLSHDSSHTCVSSALGLGHLASGCLAGMLSTMKAGFLRKLVLLTSQYLPFFLCPWESVCAALFSPTVLCTHFLAVKTDEGQSPHILCFVPHVWGDMASTNRPRPGAAESKCC